MRFTLLFFLSCAFSTTVATSAHVAADQHGSNPAEGIAAKDIAENRFIAAFNKDTLYDFDPTNLDHEIEGIPYDTDLYKDYNDNSSAHFADEGFADEFDEEIEYEEENHTFDDREYQRDFGVHGQSTESEQIKMEDRDEAVPEEASRLDETKPEQDDIKVSGQSVLSSKTETTSQAEAEVDAVVFELGNIADHDLSTDDNLDTLDRVSQEDGSEEHDSIATADEVLRNVQVNGQSIDEESDSEEELDDIEHFADNDEDLEDGEDDFDEDEEEEFDTAVREEDNGEDELSEDDFEKEAGRLEKEEDNEDSTLPQEEAVHEEEWENTKVNGQALHYEEEDEDEFDDDDDDDDDDEHISGRFENDEDWDEEEDEYEDGDELDGAARMEGEYDDDEFEDEDYEDENEVVEREKSTEKDVKVSGLSAKSRKVVSEEMAVEDDEDAEYEDDDDLDFEDREADDEEYDDEDEEEEDLEALDRFEDVGEDEDDEEDFDEEDEEFEDPVEKVRGMSVSDFSEETELGWDDLELSGAAVEHEYEDKAENEWFDEEDAALLDETLKAVEV